MGGPPLASAHLPVSPYTDEPKTPWFVPAFERTDRGGAAALRRLGFDSLNVRLPRAAGDEGTKRSRNCRAGHFSPRRA